MQSMMLTLIFYNIMELLVQLITVISKLAIVQTATKLPNSIKPLVIQRICSYKNGCRDIYISINTCKTKLTLRQNRQNTLINYTS